MGISRWILGVLGWTLNGPVGAVVGFFIGRAIEQAFDEPEKVESERSSYSHSGTSNNRSSANSRRYYNNGTKDDLSAALLVLIAAMMNADNVIRKSELDLVKRFLVSNYGEEKAKELLLNLRDLNGKDIPVSDVCRQIKQNTDYTTRFHMLDFLFSIADADGDISRQEILLLHNISSNLGIATRDYISIKSRHNSYGGNFGGNWNDGGYDTNNDNSSSYSSNTNEEYHAEGPYSVLGLDSSATDDEVKKAYRRLAMKYHPDRVENLGEEVRRNAEEQFKKINDAYETIKQARGMK